MILSCEKSESEEWIYTLEVKRLCQPDQILFRSDTDFWNFHNLLLHSCKTELGSELTPRILPFLEPVTGKLSLAQALCRKKKLDFYVREIQYLSVLGIQNGSINRFFSMRMGDVESELDFGNESLGMIMNRLTGLKTNNRVSFSISHGELTQHWTERDVPNLRTLLKIVGDRFVEDIIHLFYKNELGSKRQIHSDKELLLLINGSELVHYSLDIN